MTTIAQYDQNSNDKKDMDIYNKQALKTDL